MVRSCNYLARLCICFNRMILLWFLLSILCWSEKLQEFTSNIDEINQQMRMHHRVIKDYLNEGIYLQHKWNKLTRKMYHLGIKDYSNEGICLHYDKKLGYCFLYVLYNYVPKQQKSTNMSYYKKASIFYLTVIINDRLMAKKLQADYYFT